MPNTQNIKILSKIFMKNNGKIFSSILLIILSIFLLLTLSRFGLITEANFQTGFTSLFGTICGAAIAFKLNKDKEENRLKNDALEKNKKSINSALFILLRQFNATILLERHCEAYKKYPEFHRALLMPATIFPDYSAVRFDFKELNFLVDMHKPEIAMNLSLMEETFSQMFGIFQRRNNTYVDRIQPIMKEHNFHSVDYTDEQREKLFSIDLRQIILRETNDVYDFIEHCKSDINKVRNELTAVAKEIFPGERFLSFEAVAK